jgi:cholesterol oxidase
MHQIAEALGGELHDSPLWWLKRVVTVHPLGGVPMGRHIGEGVVDEWGESFASPGLYVLDGSAMPGPVGANPSLTIAAFADRAATHILESGPGRSSRAPAAAPTVPTGGPVPPTPDIAPDVAPAGTAPAGATALSFTEEMKGFVTRGEVDFDAGFDIGREAGTAFMFHLTITADDVDRFLGDPDHHGDAVGWVEGDLFGGRLPVERGDFNLFVADAGPRRTHMYYRLYFADSVGQQWTMTGFKDVHDDQGFDVWTDTSTLYIRILRGHVAPADDEGAEILASGKLRILIPDFARQLTTFRVDGPGPTERVAALAAFGRSFMGDLWDVFGKKAETEVESR